MKISARGPRSFYQPEMSEMLKFVQKVLIGSLFRHFSAHNNSFYCLTLKIIFFQVPAVGGSALCNDGGAPRLVYAHAQVCRGAS